MSTPQGDDTAQDLTEPAQDLTEPAQDTAGSSASTDPGVADLESDLLGGQGGDDTATPDAEQPADTTTPDSGGEESSVSEVQKLTGQLTQKMREAGQQMQPTDFKSVINSVIAAMDMSQLSEEDTNDIIKKIKKQTNKGEDGEMNEYGEQYGYESDNVMYNNEPARFRASGGQTVGENTLNEKLELIIKRAKENVLREKK
jgi:hypothetical protein